MTKKAVEEVSTEDDDQVIRSLFPEPVIVTAGPFKLSIMPMDTGTCLRCSRAFRPIVRALLEVPDVKSRTVEAIIESPEFILAIADNEDGFYQALGLAIDRPPEFVAKLPPGAATALAYLVWTLNIDFFVRAVGSLAYGSKATPTPTAAANGDGQKLQAS
jgi:hypothetical protein